MQALDFPSSGRFGRLWAGWSSAKFASDGPPGKLYVKLKWQFSHKGSIYRYLIDLVFSLI